MSNFKHGISNGFTLIELIIAMGIFSTIVAISTISLVNIQHKSTLSAAVNTFVADMKGQQLRAMVGDTDGQGAVNNYGIHMETTSYTLFRNSYGTANFVIPLGANLQFTSAGSQIVFTKGSGEPGAATSVIMKDPVDGSQKTITINRYGVVTAVN